MFAVESEVAEKIANTLQARLTGEEQQALAVTPTRSDAAYDAYLRGLAYERLAAVAPEIFETAIGFYNEAVRLDPQFAVAWAHLAMVQSAMYHFGFDHTPMRLEAMKRAAETAMKLQPNLGESLLAWGFYQYRGTQDYFAADKAFDDARQRLPNDAWTVECGSFVKRRQGKWDQAITLLEKVMQLDPRNAQVHSELGYTLLFTRNFKRAREVAAHGLAIAPDDATLTALTATVSQAEGDLDGADRALASQPLQPGNPTVFTTQMTQLLFRRNFGQAISALSAALQFPDNSLGGQLGEYYVILSLAQHASGDEAGARATCEQGIAYLDQIRATNADTWFVSACFGLLRAGLGDEAGAMREGEHSFALTGPDVSARPDVEEAITRMNARLGRVDAAMNVVPRLLHESYQKSFFGAVLTPALLRLDPAFDSLGNDPRFQELCATP
ncbi:MAG: tetratricopeptide repeat protein [Chthoniobacterales bacterium]